ncbi:MAG: hypothetical protein MJ237_01715 [bacterium]|nr:hypothetical protein [bacterium]
MTNSVQNVNKVNTGLCPHGLAPGACPICSSGGGTLRQSDKNRQIGEMTYHECAMIGNMLKARALAQKNHEHNLKLHEMNVQNFENVMTKLAVQMREFQKMFSGNIILRPLAVVISAVTLPVINFVQNIPKYFQVINNIRFEIFDKLNAIYGEAKAFINKKISELSDLLKQKLRNLFKIFKKNKSDQDSTKIDEDKKIFNLKTILHKISKKLKKQKDRDDGRNTKD